MPTTFLNTTFYFQGFLQGLGPQRGEEGVLTLTLPLGDGKLLSGVDVADIDRTAFAILKGGAGFIGRTVGLVGDHLTGAQYAEKPAGALGEPVRFQSVPNDYFRTLEIPLAEELGKMFQYYGDFDREFTGVGVGTPRPTRRQALGQGDGDLAVELPAHRRAFSAGLISRTRVRSRGPHHPSDSGAPLFPPGASRFARTGCLLMIETRLNALMVTATQIAAEIWSSVSTCRAAS
ncbi:hypothetical protein QF037_000935 [Streptomyces canus]|nr:hypothetical protein [Streptomyces canus]